MRLTAGAHVGPYQIVSALGAGGMGEVYRATDTNLGRQVAIKVLPQALASAAERLARFDREAKTLAAVSHPNIAAIYSVERTPDATALVMELVEGPTLADRIAQGAVPLDDALAIARQIAAALTAAHEQGIVHRDLKPANIKVRPDGTVKVLDFGLAKLTDPNVPHAPNAPHTLSLSPTITSPALATGVGTLLGTAAYMSPEQARGKAVDKRSDIWAFGVVVHEMLTGAPLFPGETVTDVLAAVVTRTPDLARVPSSMRRLLDACLQKDPARRLRDIADFELLLESATPNAPTRPPGTWIPWTAAGAFALVAAGLGMLALGRPEPAVSPSLQFEMALSPDEFRGRPSLSPDGTMLAYHARGSDGRPMMSVRRLDALEPRAVAGTDMTIPTELIWSHDSRDVAFWVNGVIKRVRVPDGPVEEIAATAEPLGGAWNADGVLLLGSRSGGLRRLSTTDRSVSEATTLDRGLGDSADRNPSFLPDGRHFTFRRLGDPKRNGVWIGSLDPRVVPRKLTDALAGGFAGDVPGLGPALLLLRDSRMFAQQIDLDRLELVGEARPVVEVAGAGATASRTGVLAFIQAPGTQVSQLWWYDRAGRVAAVDARTHRYQSIDLSPDGRRLSSTRFANGIANLWLEDLTRGSEARLTTGLSYSALWSPDGAHIVFNQVRGGLATIYRRRSNGTGAEEVVLTQDRDVWGNDWSSDGRYLLYSTPSDDAAAGLDVGYLAIDDPQRRPTPYLSEAFTQKQAQFSPDGRFVAYISDESGRFEVYVRTFPDPNLGKWPISVNGGVEPRWSRDGRELFYWSGRTLHVVDVKTTPTFAAGAALKLFDAPIQAGYLNDSHRWQVSPDGQRFVVLALQESAPATIRVIVNWPSLLQRGPGTY